MKTFLLGILLCFLASPVLASEPEFKTDLITVKTEFQKPNLDTMQINSTFDFNVMLNSIIKLDFPESEYFTAETAKTQIYLHHTASGKGVSGDHRTFLKPGRIGTSFIVGHKHLYELFSHYNWGYHLGVPKSLFAKYNLPYLNLNTNSIGIEIDSWGPLKLIAGEFRAWPNKFGFGSTIDKRTGKALKVVVNSKDVIEYANGFRGYNYFERYTNFQLDTTKFLIDYLTECHKIPMHYNSDMWGVSTNALKGMPGVYTHVSVREDKSDCHPQKELISMLKSLA